MQAPLKVLAIGASNSKNSINRRLARFAASSFEGAVVDDLDLNALEMPLFSVDREAAGGVPPQASEFLARIAAADVVVLSLAEHNGSYSVAFKNVLDWASRLNGKPFQSKPMLLMATSTGGRGGASALEAAKGRFPFMGADIRGTFSLPLFDQNFDDARGITSSELRATLLGLIAAMRA